MKKYIYLILVGFFIFTVLDVGAVNFGLERVSDELKGADIQADGIVGTVVGIVSYLVGFFYLIALVLGIYAGFLVMTSAGDEERVKKGKNIFIYVIIGLIVVFLASTIIDLVVSVFDESKRPVQQPGVIQTVPTQSSTSGASGDGAFNFPQGSNTTGDAFGDEAQFGQSGR